MTFIAGKEVFGRWCSVYFQPPHTPAMRNTTCFVTPPTVRATMPLTKFIFLAPTVRHLWSSNRQLKPSYEGV